ncbi:MAG: helix-turn-helix domain-containing protein [Bacteroidota bacterium]
MEPIPFIVVTKIHAQLNKVYFINRYTLVLILGGSGDIQVDFKNYNNWQDKAIYLEKGQYIKFLSNDFIVRFIEFPDEIMFRSKDVRILFKHLISLGYINYNECEECQAFLEESVFNDAMARLIDISTEQWYWQNPFQASKQEYQIIFDIKDIIDQEFTNNMDTKDLIAYISNQQWRVQHLVKDKLGISVKKLLRNKMLTESKKDVAFTDKSIKEIAFDKGFKDPAYFNRVFTAVSGQTPLAFRNNFDFENRDCFVQDLLQLVDSFHGEERTLDFYADRMNMSVKTLSRKVAHKMNTSLGQLIRSKIISSATALLAQGEPIKEVAFALGFEEAHHFSAFFHHYTGNTPSSVLA